MNLLIDLFKQVQRIPYKCRGNPQKLFEVNLPYANCSQKRELLNHLLQANKYQTRYLDAVFDWRDLPIPKDILKILKQSGTFQRHHLLEVRVDNTYLKVDPTWNLELGSKGFPVTFQWEGNRDTKQVTEGTIFFYDPQKTEVSLPYFFRERKDFAQEFNRWLGW